MRAKIFKSNIAFGVLVAFVLAFGVQGIADALTLTITSGETQSQPEGITFEMSFSVGLTNPKIAYHPNYPLRRVNANDDSTYIDSSGYPVSYIEPTNTSYRNTSGTAAVSLGNFVVDPRPQYSTNSNGSTADPAAAGTVSGNYLVHTNGQLYDSNGKIIYIQTGSGTRDNPTSNENEDSPWRYVEATLSNTTGIATAEKVTNTLSALHDYNDEAIGITITRPSAGTGTLKLKSPSYTFGSITKPSDLTADYEQTVSLKEMVDIGLPSPITLVYQGASVGKHTIEIWDATANADFPPVVGPSASRPRDVEIFTLHVTPSTVTVANNDDIEPDIKTVRTDHSVQPVSDYFTFPQEGGADKNYSIRYRVMKGSGTLYVGTIEQEHTTPTTSLSVHQSTPVFIKLKGTSNEVHLWFADEDRVTPRATIIYEYDGKPLTSGGGDPDPSPATTRGSLNISLSGSGSTRTVTVTALNPAGTTQSGISVILNVNNGATLSRTSGGTPLTSTLTLPAAAGDYTLTATTTADYNGASETITVTLPGTLSLALIGSEVNGAQTVQVTARTATGSLETTPVTVTLSGAGISRTVVVTGSQNVPIVLPTTSGTLTASATGYNSGTRILPARTTTPPTGGQPETGPQPPAATGQAGVANSIEIDGSRSISGTVNQGLRLRTRVTDANGTGVSNVKVTYRVRAPGKGRLSQRGNGRAIQAQTDRRGYASATLTPLGGDLIVEAKAAGVTAAVTFIISISDAPDEPAETPSPGDDRQPDIIMIDPVVHVKAESRPPMLWIDQGTIYALVGAEVQEFGSGVENAQNIAIGGDKVYWTEKTGESSGTINSANLDGTDAKELKEIQAVPMGIAVDTAGSKLYWSNSRGRVQSANLDGSGIRNVVTDLFPTSVVFNNGSIYILDKNPSITAVTNIFIFEAGRPQNGSAMGISGKNINDFVISGGKIYFTAITSESAGSINNLSLKGSGRVTETAIQAVPSGIAVDTARSKLYWTNSRGRVQSANLDGSGIKNVVTGLGSPGDMVISNSIKAPTTTTTTTTTTTASNKYDVNGDGKVDGKDKALVFEAVVAGTFVAKYDVNGDKKVDILDYVLVDVNADIGAAAAPSLLGMQFSALEVGRLQEQIDLLIASGDRSPAAIKTLIYLQQLIATARPEKTQLLANYPNPFNPETWIPYELATDTEVRITIYNAQGVVIRTLQLGQQSAGYYTDRERAAYWDGRNALGEQVASGIYFYQLETDEISSMRKMVILK